MFQIERERSLRITMKVLAAVIAIATKTAAGHIC